MTRPSRVEIEDLRQQLEHFQKLNDLHMELLVQNPLLHEQIRLGMDLVENYIRELSIWETSNDGLKYAQVLAHARTNIDQIHALFRDVTDQ